MASIAEILAAAAQRSGLPLDYFTRSAQIESSMNPHATSKLSSARGLFQILNGEAKRYGIDPFDPVQATDAFTKMSLANRDYLRQHLGREPTSGELYLAHQQGPAGAVAELLHPDAPAGSLVPAINITNNGGDPNQPAGQFANRFLARFNGVANPTPTPTPQPSVPSVPSVANPTVTLAMNPQPLSDAHTLPAAQPQPLAIPADQQIFPYSASGTQPQTYENPGITPSPPPEAAPAAPSATPAQTASGGLGGMLGNPMLAMSLMNAFKPPQQSQAIAQPKKQGLDLGSLFAELSPNLVLGKDPLLA